MFKRKIYQELLKWKNESKGTSALLIEGARRVGKTKIAEFFGANEFQFYKTIDCHSHNQCLDKFKEVAKAYSKKVSSSVYEKNQKEIEHRRIRRA